MKTNNNLIALAIIGLCSLSFPNQTHAQEGGSTDHGGDLCEDVFEGYSKNFRNWLRNGNADGSDQVEELKFKDGETADHFRAKTLEYLAPYADHSPNSKIVFSCVGHPVYVDGEEKTCIWKDPAKDPEITDGKIHAECNFNRFVYGMVDPEQKTPLPDELLQPYQLKQTVHEWLSIAGEESDQDTSHSIYFYTDQINNVGKWFRRYELGIVPIMMMGEEHSHMNTVFIGNPFEISLSNRVKQVNVADVSVFRKIKNLPLFAGIQATGFKIESYEQNPNNPNSNEFYKSKNSQIVFRPMIAFFNQDDVLIGLTGELGAGTTTRSSPSESHTWKDAWIAGGGAVLRSADFEADIQADFYPRLDQTNNSKLRAFYFFKDQKFVVSLNGQMMNDPQMRTRSLLGGIHYNLPANRMRVQVGMHLGAHTLNMFNENNVPKFILGGEMGVFLR